ncbi:biotin transporter BioY [Allokutzneria albata]|uniref:Biotin transporter n=1 Tax=Allokutzneria albata TaxID=211114 RepID=A0A1G9R0T8_ALLAB|nr:biotin transporter BioY [Allokutzneria albata]SDM16813.1 biotin transport system substrate-specific component [Allokutzneria albata]
MRTKDLVHVALFAAIVVVLALFPAVPLPFVPVPITAQSLGVMLAGSVLGARKGGLALLVFVALVAVGLPVLSSGAGGLAALLRPSGGFVLSWPIAAFVIGWLTERVWNRYNLAWALLCNAAGGIVVSYLIGVPFLAVAGGLDLGTALTGSLAFVPGDAVKVVLASIAGVTVRRAYPLVKAP